MPVVRPLGAVYVTDVVVTLFRVPQPVPAQPSRQRPSDAEIFGVVTESGDEEKRLTFVQAGGGGSDFERDGGAAAAATGD